MVKVEHRVIKDERAQGREAKTVFGSKEPCTLVRDYRTLLRNTKSTPIDITVVELFPRSSDKKIEITLTAPPRESTPMTGEGTSSATGEGELKVGETKQNKVTNNIVFNRRLEPQQKMELAFGYSVKYPHDAGTGYVEIS